MAMFRRVWGVSLVILWVAGSACSTVEIMSDRNESIDFSKYRSFTFTEIKASEEAPVEFNELNQKRVQNAISSEFQKRNYSKTTKADVVVSVYLRVKDKQKIVGHSTYYGGPYYYGYYSGYRYGSFESVDYREGTLVIDVVDARQNELVWQGVAQGVMADKPKNVEEKINKVVAKIFEEYPQTEGMQ